MIRSIIFYYYYYGGKILHLPAITIPPAGIDKFGIMEIYSTKPGGEQWYFSINDPNSDPRADKGEGPPCDIRSKELS